MAISKRYILAVLIVSAFVIGLVLIWVGSTNPSVAESTGRTSSAPAQATPKANVTIVPAVLNQQGVPSQLASLSLTRLVTGTQALANFSQLHGDKFDLVDGYEAHYGSDQAVLYVARAQDAAGAQRLLDQMAQKIGPNNATFQNLQALDISGRTLYSAVTPSQQHFFYAVDDKVVWLAANDALAPDALHSLWSVVK